MRVSKMLLATLREEPAGAEAVSHKLLLRAGYIRQLTSGVYSLLPLAQRVRRKVMRIIREEMEAIGAQEFLLSGLQPLELWDESGRTAAVSDVMFRLKDRRGAELALGLTHEEVFTSIARSTLSSYKQLPQIWYQMHTKFRDEARPKSGLLRVREFTMKDSYSFDNDEAGMDHAFELHRGAYEKIFKRCSLNFIPVQASSGAMGGSASVEFMALTPAGEDILVLCQQCGYAANLEKAQSKFEPSALPTRSGDTRELNQLSEKPEKFPTPGIRTIVDLANFEHGAPADRQIKTLVFLADGKLMMALVQGDQELNEAKLQSILGAGEVKAASEGDIVDALGARPGSLGGCGVPSGPAEKIKTIIADARLRGRINMVTGANVDDFHLRGVSVDRDITVKEWVDLHTVKEGEACITCGGSISLEKGLEIGHIFKLGRKYSESMNAKVLTADGKKEALWMGSYGIGVERLMGAIVESSHDDSGIKWPVGIAPFDVIVLPVNTQDEKLMTVATAVYEQCQNNQIDVLLDDRDERAGIKFKDADLIGIPWRVTVGKKAGEGIVELFDRFSGMKADISVDALQQILLTKIRPVD